MSFFRDVLVTQLDTGSELTNPESWPDIDRLARAGTPEATLRRLEAIGVARERIEANVAPLLAVEALMVALLGEVPMDGARRRAG